MSLIVSNLKIRYAAAPGFYRICSPNRRLHLIPFADLRLNPFSESHPMSGRRYDGAHGKSRG
jgi:hypothetical protein